MKLTLGPYQFPNGVQIKNQMLMAPMTTNSGTETGALSEADSDFILSRSRDFGAVIIGSHSVSPTGDAFASGWNIYQAENRKALQKMVDQLHQQDVKAIIQLYHAGRLAQPVFINGAQPMAPSRIPAKRSFASYPREMTTAEIDAVIRDFQKAVQTAIAIGFDGIELHGANTYLIQQFYSPHSNRRTDVWGGALENRLRFPCRIIEACLATASQSAKKPFVVGYRFSPEEFESPGIRLEDTRQLLKRISQYPIDYVHVSLSDYRKRSQEGVVILDELSRAVPSTVPLIGCGNIHDQQDVQAVLSKVPLFSVGNAVLIDPDWATKIVKEPEKIRRKLKLTSQEASAIPKPLWEILKQSPLTYFQVEGAEYL